jgi:DNA-binding NtrC family response regulator
MKGNNGNGSPAHKMTRVLVIDDEPEMLRNYERLLKRAGHESRATTNPTEVKALLKDFQPELVVTDLMMPEVDGMEVLEMVHAWDSTVPVIIVTAYGSVERAVFAMKHHAADFLIKPFSMNELLQKVQEALSARMIGQVAEHPVALDGVGAESFAGMVGISPAMQFLFDRLRKVARMDVNVLVTGESGTGKELVARAVHSLSPRRKNILAPIDCASLPENLLESELFGYSKGSFTGAHADKKGLLEFADKGTLFLDEVGELPLSLQVKLLRVLQERKFRPIGCREEVAVDVRVVAATNRALEEEVAAKTFRSDLYYRLNVVNLVIPPLRERREDILLLANHFLRTFTREQSLPNMILMPDALEALRQYHWPGNVRELQNAMEHAATLSSGNELTVRNLPPDLQGGHACANASLVSSHLFEEKERLVSGFEKEYLITLLADNQFNITQAAKAAGCHRRTLYRMIQRYEIDIDSIQRERRAVRIGAGRNRPTDSLSE